MFGLEQITFIHYTIPHLPFVALAPLPLFACVTHNLIGWQIDECGADIHEFAAVDHIVNQPAFGTGIRESGKQPGTDQIGGEARRTHSLLLVVVNDLIVVGIIAAEIHIQSDRHIGIVKEEHGGIESADKSVYLRHADVGVEIGYSCEGCGEFALHGTHIGKGLQHKAVGMFKAISSVMDEQRQGVDEIGCIACRYTKGLLKIDRHKLRVGAI